MILSIDYRYTEASIPPAEAGRCHMRSKFYDSQSAIRQNYRTLLRSSSVWEPRHPLSKLYLDVEVQLVSFVKVYLC